jgi:hypothetical protein
MQELERDRACEVASHGSLPCKPSYDDHLVFVLVPTEGVMVCPANDNPASCETRAVIGFLHAKNMSAAEINRKLYAVCGRNVMSEGTVRQWRRILKHGRTNFHDEEGSLPPAICSE